MTRSVLGWSVAAGTGLVALFMTADASAFCRMTTDGGAQIGNARCIEEGAPLEWADTCLSYAIDEQGSEWMDFEEIEAAVDASFATWTQADCGDGAGPNVVFKPLQPSTCQRAEFNTTGNVNTIAFRDPWRDPCDIGECVMGPDEGTPCIRDEQCRASRCSGGYDPSAFAVTIVWHNTSTGQILDADMMINDQLAGDFTAGGPYANCPDEGCEDPGPADLSSIVTHEIGHFMGIGHSDVEEATMFASAERDSVEKRTLAQDDIEAICEIYPPGTLDSSCNPTPIGGLALNCETDDEGEPLACDDPGSPQSNRGGCSACAVSDPSDGPWAALVATLIGLSVMRRRSRRLA